jgi:lipopolysaccharide biosynthesis glycosyltransferase
MINSIFRVNPNSTIYVLALDRETDYLLKSINFRGSVKTINLKTIIKYYPFLKDEEKKRKYNEFCFLLTPFLIDFILKSKKIDKVFYCDADLIFFSKFEKILNMLDDKSILATTHNFDKKNKFQEKINGKFNVGFLGFKNDKVALECLSLWKNLCFFSTSIDDSVSSVIRGDQLYLNLWPIKYKNRFKKISISNFNIGAWNIHKYFFSCNKNLIYSNNKKLIMIHANFINFFLINVYNSIAGKQFRILNNFIYKYFKLEIKKINLKKLPFKNNYNLKLLLKNFLLKNLYKIELFKT